MSRKRVISIALAGIFFIAFAVFTHAVQIYDLQPIGPECSLVGFADFNIACINAFGSSEVMYELTEALGWLAILICGVFGIIGFVQLVKGRSLKKVDPDIICMGILYILTIAAYVIFTQVTINVRPVLENGQLESSYPSSHTMLAIVVFSSLIVEISRRIKDRTKALIEEIACLGIICIAVMGRMLSGMHWATDIIGGIILSLALVCVFIAILPERK